MHNEKISVIIPAMNVEPYLRQCLDSIIVQTYTELEILLIYTESNDQTLRICEEYVAKDARILLLKNETGMLGAGIARNIGLRNATGEYLGFVDADDIIAVDMFRILYDNMKKYQADISICKETRNLKDVKCKVESSKVMIFDTEESLAELLVGNKYHGELWNKLFKKKCIGTTEFINSRVAEDVMFVWTVLKETKRIVYTDAKRYFYRFNPDGISKQYSLDNITMKKKVYDSIYNDVVRYYPAIQQTFINRIAIVNAQNYVAGKLAGMRSKEIEKELLQIRKKYRLKNDGYNYNKKEFVQTKIFELSPGLLYGLYRLYYKLRGRG